MRKFAFGLLAVLAIGSAVPAGAKTEPITTDRPLRIALPADNDEYSRLVAQAAAHDTSVDFHALRFAYLKSAARKRIGGLGGDDSLQQKMMDAAKTGDDVGVRAAAEALLSVKYADLRGQAFLSSACERLHDDACAAQAGFVARGLVKSIFDSGDGKTCQTGWEVAAVEEEYFVLHILEAEMQMQSLVTGSPSCDVLETAGKDGKPATYFFRIDAVLADEMDTLNNR